MPFDPSSLTALRYGRDGHVATITINRPDVRNALNRAAYDELEAAFRHVQSDPEVRCVILTGVDPAFCAGEDIRQMMTGDQRAASLARLKAVTPVATPAAEAALACDRPIICAVNGIAVGWGMDLTLFADIRIASETARFGELFVKRGLVADLGGLWRLPRLVGPQQAARLLYTGEIIDAAEALRIGLVMEVVPHAGLMARARALAGAIAENPPLAVRHLKAGLARSERADYREMGAWIAHTLGILFETEDHQEGVRSFLEKRPARYTSR